MPKSSSVLRIRQVRSKIGQNKKQRDALRTLGLRRIGQVVERPDNPAVRGTVRFVGHLVRVEDGAAETAPRATAPVTVVKKSGAKTAEKKTATNKKAKTSKKKASGGNS